MDFLGEWAEEDQALKWAISFNVIIRICSKKIFFDQYFLFQPLF